MACSIFTPIVTVDDDGTVTIDWADSYFETQDADGRTIEVTDRHGERLHQILGPAGDPDWIRLRRLADAMEAAATTPATARDGATAAVGGTRGRLQTAFRTLTGLGRPGARAAQEPPGVC